MFPHQSSRSPRPLEVQDIVARVVSFLSSLVLLQVGRVCSIFMYCTTQEFQFRITNHFSEFGLGNRAQQELWHLVRRKHGRIAGGFVSRVLFGPLLVNESSPWNGDVDIFLPFPESLLQAFDRLRKDHASTDLKGIVMHEAKYAVSSFLSSIPCDSLTVKLDTDVGSAAARGSFVCLSAVLQMDHGSMKIQFIFVEHVTLHIAGFDLSCCMFSLRAAPLGHVKHLLLNDDCVDWSRTGWDILAHLSTNELRDLFCEMRATAKHETALSRVEKYRGRGFSIASSAVQ